MPSAPELRKAVEQAQKSSARVAGILTHWTAGEKVIKKEIRELQQEKKQLDAALTILLRALHR